MQETQETRDKLANAIKTLRSTGREGEVNSLVGAYKSKYRNPVNVGYDVPTIPLTPEAKAQRLSNAQTEADKAKKISDEANSVSGMFTQTSRNIVKNLASSEIGLGKTIAKTLGNQAPVYADNIQKLSQARVELQKLIKDKEVKGQDATNLKRVYNQNLALSKELGTNLNEEANLPTTGQAIGQLGGTALDVLTAGTYGKVVTTGMKSFELASKTPLLKTAVSAVSPELGKVADIATQTSGLFTKKGATNVLKGAGIGYGYDISQGLQGSRGEDRAGAKAFIPGLGTAIGGGIPAVTEGVQSIQNARNPKYQANRLAEKRQTELNKLDSYQTLKKATEKGRERGIDIKKVLSDTDVLHGSVDKTGTITTKGEGGAVEQYTKQFIDGNESIVSDALKKEGRSIAPGIVWKKLRGAVMKSGIEGKALTNALANVDREMAGYAIKGQKSGAIPLATLHDAKVNKYNNINFFTEGNAKQYDKTIAKALKEIVEKESKDVRVRSVNKELLKHFAVIDYLNKLDNKKVSGGKLGKYFAQTVGAIVGSHFGPVGSIAGAELGGRIKGGAMERSFQGKTRKRFPQAKAITETNNYINQKPMELPQSRSNNFGNLQTNQAVTNNPIRNGIK